jgi:hypothetical protein
MLLQWLAPIGLIAAGACSAAPRVQHINGHMYVDGKPFFPVGYWGSETDPAVCREQLMNCALSGLDKTPERLEAFKAYLAKCEAAGLMVIPYFPCFVPDEDAEDGVVGWMPAHMDPYLDLADSPAILAWNIGDDMMVERMLEAIKRESTHIRQRDPVHPIVADAMGRPMDSVLPFRPYLDITMEYTYPLPFRTIDEYREWLDLRRRELGEPRWTYLQAFNTRNTWQQLGVGGWGRGPTPDPEQMRLLWYTALQTGVRGIVFFSEKTLGYHPELAPEASLLAADMELVGDHYAAGTITDTVKAVYTWRSPSLRASCHDWGRSKLITLLAVRPHYHRYVDDAVLEGFPVRVEFTGQWDHSLPNEKQVDVHLVTFPEVRKIDYTGRGHGAIEFRIERMELCELVLITPKEEAERVEAIKQRMADLLPKVAAWKLQSARAQLAKVSSTLKAISEAGVDVAEATDHINAAEPLLGQAEERLEAGQHQDAYTLAADAMRFCREAVAAQMSQSWQEAGRKLHILYGLPDFYGEWQKGAAEE